MWKSVHAQKLRELILKFQHTWVKKYPFQWTLFVQIKYLWSGVDIKLNDVKEV